MERSTTPHQRKEQLGAWTPVPACRDIDFCALLPRASSTKLNEAQAAAKLKLKLKPKIPQNHQYSQSNAPRHSSLPPGQMK